MKKKKSTTPKTVDELVEGWTGESGSNQHLGAIRDLVRYLSSELYEQYQPFGGKALFWERLARWLQNLDTKRDQQSLLEMVPWLLFVGLKEMEAMYRAAFVGPIARWLIDEAKLDITATDLPTLLQDELRMTFFGSIAGMDINGFARINGLAGQSDRPNFREHSRLGNFSKFKREFVKSGYKRIVAVEDMVGTGTQMVEAAPILAHMSPYKVLLCPVIVAPAGVDRWHQELKPNYGNFAFEPLFVIPENATIPKQRGSKSEPYELQRFREVLTKTWAQVRGLKPSDQLYSEFGFGDFGALVLSFLNCPDNVPPLIHYEGDQWHALFPRLSREG